MLPAGLFDCGWTMETTKSSDHPFLMTRLWVPHEKG